MLCCADKLEGEARLSAVLELGREAGLAGRLRAYLAGLAIAAAVGAALLELLALLPASAGWANAQSCVADMTCWSGTLLCLRAALCSSGPSSQHDVGIARLCWQS